MSTASDDSMDELSDWGYVNSEGTKEIAVVAKSKHNELTSLYEEARKNLKIKEEDINKRQQKIASLQENIQEHQKAAEKKMKEEQQKYDSLKGIYESAQLCLKLKDDQINTNELEIHSLFEEIKELTNKCNTSKDTRELRKMKSLYDDAKKSIKAKDEKIKMKIKELEDYKTARGPCKPKVKRDQDKHTEEAIMVVCLLIVSFLFGYGLCAINCKALNRKTAESFQKTDKVHEEQRQDSERSFLNSIEGVHNLRWMELNTDDNLPYRIEIQKLENDIYQDTFVYPSGRQVHIFWKPDNVTRSGYRRFIEEGELKIVDASTNRLFAVFTANPFSFTTYDQEPAQTANSF